MSREEIEHVRASRVRDEHHSSGEMLSATKPNAYIFSTNALEMPGKESSTFVLVQLRVALLLLLAVVAWHANPDENGFRRWFNRELLNPQHVEASVSQKVIPLFVNAIDLERTNFGFASLMTLHDVPVMTTDQSRLVVISGGSKSSPEFTMMHFAGLFGMWFPLR